MPIFDSHTNFAYSIITVAPNPSSSGSSLTINSGDGILFPTPPFNVTVWPVNSQPLKSNAEIMRVTNISGDTFTVTRTQEGSNSRAIQVGDQIANTISVKIITDIENVIGSGSAFTPLSSDPLSPTNGQAWYNSTVQEVRVRISGVTYKLPVSPI